MIGEDNSKYDFYKETPYWSNSKKRVLYGQSRSQDNQKLVEEAILKGEGPKIEFKPYIDLDNKNNRKREEILKTIVAFANLSGGVLIVGINDTCEIVGLEKDLSKKDKGQKKDDIYEKYIGALKKYVSDNLNKEVGLEIGMAFIGEHAVIVVKVPEGLDKPYMTLPSNAIFVRRGASNSKPNENELKKIVISSARGESVFNKD